MLYCFDVKFAQDCKGGLCVMIVLVSTWTLITWSSITWHSTTWHYITWLFVTRHFSLVPKLPLDVKPVSWELHLWNMLRNPRRSTNLGLLYC